MKKAPEKPANAGETTQTKTVTIYTAMQCEALAGAKSDSDQGHYTKDLFVLVGKPGVFRRVARSGQGKAKNRKESELANFGHLLIEVIPDEEINRELQQAGFKLGTPDEQDTVLEELDDAAAPVRYLWSAPSKKEGTEAPSTETKAPEAEAGETEEGDGKF